MQDLLCVRATDGGVSDTRMDARECVLRYLAFHMHPYNTYSKSDLNGFLSMVMQHLNGLSAIEINKLAENFREAMVRAHELFGRYAFRKFILNSRRGPVNKALFESWANVLQEYDLGKLREHKERIPKAGGRHAFLRFGIR
jgi:hypothetical protein